jgi:hypothetical protein
MRVWGKGRGEYEHYQDEDGNEWLWAFCEVAGCQNKVCHRINDRFCWPHLMTGGEPGEAKICDEADVR